MRLFSESSSSSDWNHQANLQGSVYLSCCKGNSFRFSSWTAFVKHTLWSSHSLEKLIQCITSLSFGFGLTALAWLWFTLTGGNESAITVDFSARETYSLWSKASNRNRSGLNYNQPDGRNKRTKLSAAKSKSNFELVAWPSKGYKPKKCLFETKEIDYNNSTSRKIPLW